MSQWYYISKGKATGPVSIDELKKAVEQGRLGPLDLVYCEGEPKWHPLGEYREFAQILKDRPATHRKAEKWVVLVRKPKEEGRGYRQKGPYSKEDVLAMIQKGEVQYSDHAWKEGMKEWYQIVSLEAFNVSRKTTLEDVEVKESLPPLPDVTGPLEEVQVQKTKEKDKRRKKVESRKRRESEKPQEAEGPDLVEQRQKGEKTVTEVGKGRKKKRRAFKPPESSTNITVVTARHSLTPKRSYLRGFYHWCKDGLKKKWVLRVVVGSVIAVMGAGVFLSLSYYNELTTPKASKKSPLLKAVPKARKKSRGKVAGTNKKINLPKKKAPPPKKPEPKIKPSYIKISGRGLKGKAPKLKILSDGSSHYPVSVQIRGLGGKILKRNSYFLSKKLFTKKSRELNLASMRLPQGSYVAEAEIDEKKKTYAFFLGVKNKKFKEALWFHKKSLAFSHQEERSRLIPLTSRIEKSTGELVKMASKAKTQIGVWQKFWPQWRRSFLKITSSEMRTVGPKSSYKYVHPFKWIQLRELKRQISQSAESFHRGDKKSVADLRALLKKASRLRQDCLKASLWP